MIIKSLVIYQHFTYFFNFFHNLNLFNFMILIKKLFTYISQIKLKKIYNKYQERNFKVKYTKKFNYFYLYLIINLT
jgi:hypothetical protein